MNDLEERIEALENLTPVIGDHGKRLLSLEKNVADHESMIGRIVDKIRFMWGRRLFT